MDYDQNPDYIQELLKRIDLNGLGEKKAVNVKLRETNGRKLKEQKRCVVVRSFEPTDDLRSSTELPLLRLEVGDRVLVVKVVGEWAVGRQEHNANSDFGMFPLHYVLPLSSNISCLEAEVLDTADRWLHYNRQLYIHNGSKVEYQKGVELINRLLEFLKIRNTNSNDVISFIDEGNTFFGAGVSLRRERDFTVAPEDFNIISAVEFIEKRQYRKELIAKNEGQRISTSSYHSDFSLQSQQSFTSLLLRFKGKRLVEEMFELDAQILDKKGLPIYETFWVTKLLEDEFWILLQDFPTTNDLQLQICGYELSWQELPGQLSDEFLHTRLNAALTSNISLSTTHNNTSFKRCVELKRMHKQPTTIDTTEQLQSQIQIKLYGEVIASSSIFELSSYLEKRKLRCIRLTPFVSSTLRSDKKSENRNSAHFSFDFFDYLKEFKRMEVIVQVVDSNGKQQKDALMTILNSTRKNTSDELLFYNYKVGSSKEQHPHVLNVQIRLPTEENCTLYLRLLLNVIVNDGKHNKTQQLHLAFVKVVDSGLLVESGKTNLLIYKVNSVANLNRLHYAKLVDRKQHDKVKHESTTTIDGFTLLDLHVPTQIVAFSQIYTQDPNVLFLLNSVDFQQQNAMEKAIENLCAVSSDFSIFIPRIFGRLFTKIGTVEKLDKKLFDFVCYAMLRAENPEEAHLKSVIAKEIEKIDNPMIFRPFLNQLIGALTADLVSTVEIKRWIEMLEITSQLVELIIKSYFVFADTNDEFEVSVVHEELENSFHLLLTTIINRLDDNLMNNKCTIVKNLPLMFNSLLLHEMVTPEFLVNFSIDLVKRIPVDMFVIRIQTVRSIIKSDLFDGQSHYCLASTLIPEIGSCLEKASNQPVALFSLLNTTIATLSDLMSKLTLMLTSSNGECNARETFVHVVDSTFSLIIQNCTFDNYNGCKDIQSRSQYLFASMLEFMDVTVFTHYLNHLPSTTDVQVLLCQIIYALRSLIEPSTRTTFNDPSIRWIFNRLVVKMFEYLRSCLIDKRTLPTFSLALWKELLHCIHAFMISTVSRMAFGIYDERNARLRLTVAELIRSLWFLLPFSLKKTNLRNMLEMLIDLLCSGCTRQIRIILMPIFSDLIATAYAESEGVIATGIDDLYKILHHRLLSHKRKKRKADEDSTITTEMNFEVQSMIESAPELNKNAKIRLLPKYLSLIEYGRQALVKKSTYQFEIVHSELVSFALQINEQSLTTELRIKIYNFQNDRGLFVEAAIGLQKCANGLSWHAKPLDSDAKFINQRMKLSCETESELKLTLYRMSIDLFQRAQAWELAIESLKELATYYEETTVDYKQLTEILNQMRLNYQKIVETIRVESFYFLVCFYGQRFPKYLQNKRYVMRGMERFGNFRQRITREFGCELITNLDAKPEELEQKRGKYVKLTTVVPVPSEKYQEMSKAANPLVSWYYKHHFVDTFDFLRPVQQKQTKWTNLKENDATKAWFQRTRYKIGFQLPNALSFGEVIEEIELERLNPPQVACKTINEANEQLKWLTKLVHNGFQDTHVTTQLVGQVRGILQAFVGGGIQNYTAFLSADEHIELDAGEKQDIEELRQLLIKQVELLDQALCAHGKCVTNETRQFHDTLVESFYEFRRTVQEICTCECKRIAVQKTGSKSNSSFETESTISDFSNSLTLPPRLSDRHSIN
ncbi:hypothetical protein M3Y95_00764400 [Aphelenchoides besseyi]|nr:hypothetical protein M3Y95_00764400 [Aphelenchoides besseyi]